MFYVSAAPERTRVPVTIEAFSQAPLVLYDAHYGWQDPTRRQLAERAQLAGVRIDPLIELEHVEAAVKLAAVGVGDTIASSAVIARPVVSVRAAHGVLRRTALRHDRARWARGRPLSRATRELARLAEDTLREVRQSRGE
ncbi:hypothetical protein STENM223S_06973 [Streptomyces tendae]